MKARKTKIVNKRTIIDKVTRKVGKKHGIKTYQTREIYNAIWDVIIDELLSVSIGQDVSVRLYEGFKIEGIYIPEHIKKIYLTGKDKTIAAKVAVKCKCSRSMQEKISEIK